MSGNYNGYDHSQQLAPISNIHNRQYQQDSSAPQILPPLHSQGQSAQTYPPAYARPAGHVSRSPAPTVPSNNTANLAQIAPHRPIGPAQPPSNYAPIVPNYSSGQPEPNGTAPSLPNSTASMHNGLYSQMSLPQLSMFAEQQREHLPGQYAQPHLPSQSQHDIRPAEPRILPVVGSQGRRGILPSAPGRGHPVGSVLDNTGRPGMSPVKDADGKYPCQFCNKTYLHLKHLKRHHLRHTGERPYQCYLCNETFCRSDILKRHFVKCSARRGNPTGATHLTHAQAHLRPAQSVPSPTSAQAAESPHPASSNPPSSFRAPWPNGTNGFSNFSQEQLQHGNTFIHDSNRSSRASSIIRPDSSEGDDRNRFTGAPTLPPMHIAMDPQTNGGLQSSRPPNAEQHYAPVNYPREQFDSTGYHDSNNSSFFPTSSAQSYPSVTNGENGHHMRGAYQHYNGLPQPGHNQHDEWKTYFQPGASSDIMFNTQ